MHIFSEKTVKIGVKILTKSYRYRMFWDRTHVKEGFKHDKNASDKFLANFKDFEKNFSTENFIFLENCISNAEAAMEKKTENNRE